MKPWHYMLPTSFTPCTERIIMIENQSAYILTADAEGEVTVIVESTDRNGRAGISEIEKLHLHLGGKGVL